MSAAVPRHERSTMRGQRRRQVMAAAAAVVIGCGAGTASLFTAESAQAAGSLDNPYAGASVYVNPEWAANATADGGAAIAGQPTFVWMDHMGAIAGDNG